MSFLCPFCGRLMDKVNDAVYICKPCDFLVNFKRKQGVIGNKAPHHLHESNLFLSQFYYYKPDFVLTKYPLLSKDFDRKDVVFFGDTFGCDHLADGGDYKGESSTLLAGKGYIADFLVDYFVQGLLIGSGCYESEVFVESRSKSEEELRNIIEFYDYVEVQPPEVYSHLIDTTDFKRWVSELEEINEGNNVEVLLDLKKHLFLPLLFFYL